MKKQNTLQKVVLRLAAVAMAMGLFFAGAIDTQAASRIRKVEYDGKGEVEVDFYGRVRWARKPVITVKDTAGKTYKVRIKEFDNDEIEFRILNYKAGTTYKFTINGVKQAGEKKFGKVSGTVKIPKARKTTRYTIKK